MIDTSHSSECRIPCPYLDEEVNSNIIQSEIEGGVYLRDLPIGAKLEIQTENRLYNLVNRGDGEVLLCGHPEFCPGPVQVTINGSRWRGSMLKIDFIGRGMRMEFLHPDYKGPITTSRVVNVRELP